MLPWNQKTRWLQARGVTCERGEAENKSNGRSFCM